MTVTYDPLAATGFRLGTPDGVGFMRAEKERIVERHGADAYADLEKAVVSNDVEAARRFVEAVAPGTGMEVERDGMWITIRHDRPGAKGECRMRTRHEAVAIASLGCSAQLAVRKAAEAKAAAEKAGYEILLSNVGNPDFRQDPDRALPGTRSGHWVPVSSWAEASRTAREYIEEWDLGGGNWSGGEVRDHLTKETVGRVSYNGRTWPTEGVECRLQETDEPSAAPGL